MIVEFEDRRTIERAIEYLRKLAPEPSLIPEPMELIHPDWQWKRDLPSGLERMNPVERARSYRAMMDELSWSLNRLGRVTGRAPSWIFRLIRIVDLPEPELRKVASGQLSVRRAYELISQLEPRGKSHKPDLVIRIDLRKGSRPPTVDGVELPKLLTPAFFDIIKCMLVSGCQYGNRIPAQLLRNRTKQDDPGANIRAARRDPAYELLTSRIESPRAHGANGYGFKPKSDFGYFSGSEAT
jgi:hypothetical protein